MNLLGNRVSVDKIQNIRKVHIIIELTMISFQDKLASRNIVCALMKP